MPAIIISEFAKHIKKHTHCASSTSDSMDALHKNYKFYWFTWITMSLKLNVYRKGTNLNIEREQISNQNRAGIEYIISSHWL